MRVLQVSAELFPLLKTGGLADVAGALPPALAQAGADVRVLLPGFPSVWAGLSGAQTVGEFVSPWGDSVRLIQGVLTCLAHPGQPEGMVGYVLQAPHPYDRPGNPYEDAHNHPYGDNHRQFATLSRAAAHLGHGLDPAWRPKVLHCHDWHTGLVPAIVRHWPRADLHTVYTVHNLAYQGLFAQPHFAELGLPSWQFDMHGLEFWGQLSFMKAGLVYADRITTVSPTYAREIQTPEQGCGLDGVLRARAHVLSGLLNGVDDAVWNPAKDAALAQPYSAHALDGKAVCKAALQAEVGLKPQARAPLFAVVSRLTEQKGLHWVLQTAHTLLSHGAQLLVLGNGDTALEEGFARLAQAHPGQAAFVTGYNEALSHRIFAGSDVTVVPSRFEPCGLTQMYAMAYGSVPLVRRVGGLADTVTDTDFVSLARGTATGVVFDAFSAEALTQAYERSLALYQRPDDWAKIQQNGMQKPMSWRETSAQYVTLFHELMDKA